MTEHNLEKPSQYIETNPWKQSPREEIRTISPHKNPDKNQPNPKNLSKEFTLNCPDTQNRTTHTPHQNRTKSNGKQDHNQTFK